jgi:hypothetical protein
LERLEQPANWNDWNQLIRRRFKRLNDWNAQCRSVASQ